MEQLNVVTDTDDAETVTFSVGDVSAEFYVSTDVEADNVDFEHERAHIDTLLDSLERDDVFYDVGANVGLYTCFAGNVLPHDRIVAFEPSPVVAGRLRQNLELNGVHPLTFQKALGSQRGTFPFDVHTGDPLGRMSSLVTDQHDGTYPVEVLDGTTLFEQYGVPEPTVLKIDVEGGEVDVLRGLEGALPSVRRIYCEVHYELLEEAGSSAEEFHDVLRANGFEVAERREWSKASINGEFVRADRVERRE